MAIIEEIPDETALPKLSQELKNQHLSLETMIEQAAGAALPDAIASVRNTSAEEFLRQMNKMPLFMTELDETGEDDKTENMALTAIKALQEEGEPWEIALNFKEVGNERFKRKNFTDAREFYTKALAANCDREDINIACLNNRAQCNLEMKNYRKCITDCRAAIALSAASEKPWFRAAKALLALDKVEEAKACVDNALLLKPGHTQILDLAANVEKRRAHLQRQEELRVERERREKWEKDAIKIALKAREIPTRTTAAPPELPDGIEIAFETPGKPDSHLLFPVLLIYHLDLQTDMIAGMPETASVGEQLAEVLAEPLAWDGKKEYTLRSVECYMETKTGGLVKVGRKVSLLEVLSGGKVEVVDGLVRILVVPRARTAEFVEKWKKTMRPSS